MGQLDGRVAIITGGGSGIGKGIARLYASEGCAVVLAGRKAERLEAAAEEMRAAGGKALAVPSDVADEDQVAALFARTMQEYGRLDILVNSAGAFDGGWIEESPLRLAERGECQPPAFLCIREAFAS